MQRLMCKRCSAVDKDLVTRMGAVTKNDLKKFASFFLCAECTLDMECFLNLIPPAYKDQVASLVRTMDEAPSPIEQKLMPRSNTVRKSQLFRARRITQDQL